MAKKGEKKITPITFKQETDKYIKHCTDKELRPLKSELCYILGIDKDTLTNYRLDSRYIEPIKRLEQLSETYLNRKLDGSASNQNAMFGLKVLHGYVEAQHIKMDLTNSDGSLGVVQLPPKKA